MGSSDRTIREKTALLMKAGRKLRGYKQVEMAEKLGITQSMISKLESATLAPDAGLWYQFCNLLGLNADLTYHSELIFTAKAQEKLEKNIFRVGNLSGNNIKVREILPFINTVHELNLKTEFNLFMKKSKVDSDVFVVPEYQIPLNVFKLVFDFLEDHMTSKKVSSMAANIYAKRVELFLGNPLSSIDKFISQLSQSEPVFQLIKNSKGIEIKIDSKFKYSIEDEAFLNKYLHYKSNQVKNVCNEYFDYKKLSVVKNNPFEMFLELTA